MAKNDNLTPEEKEILDSYDRGEWRPVSDQNGQIAKYKKIARNTLRRARPDTPKRKR